MSEIENNLRLSRRQALKHGVAAASGLALYKNLCFANTSSTPTKPSKTKAHAKSIIQIWMWGGPCHLDTFDPKPDAGYDYCGPYNNPIETNIKGIRICQKLPLLAKHADKYSIIRSMTHSSNAHETASYIVQTGHQPGRLVYPSLGGMVSKIKGYDAGYKGVVPPYIVLTQPQGRFSEAGFLGQRYKPFSTGGDPNKNPFVVEGIVAKGISDERQISRRALLASLDSLGKAIPQNQQLKKFDQCKNDAYDMMFGDARDIFDLSKEKDALRDKYGRNTFGQSCLMARRLVENGVPYVTINYKGWDTHKQHFQIMDRKLPEMDKAMAALLEDLSQRGLLDSTIVWWSGEFGRSPKILWDPPWNGGRSHYCKCFNALVAGGGFKGGTVVGASNENATEVKDRPVHPAELLACICQLLGINPDGPLPNDRGMDVKVMPLPQNSTGQLTEIMKV